MSPVLAFAIFAVIWWTVLFAVLPLGVRTQDEEGEVVPGSAPSAPGTPRMLRKVIQTTLIAALVFAPVYWAIATRAFPVDAFADWVLGVAPQPATR